MKKYYLIPLILFGTLLTSCKKEPLPDPVADFSFTIQGQYAPTDVIFVNNSQNAENFTWSFGDGTSSTDKNVTHNYATSGTYSVTVAAVNSEGATNSTTKQVIINRKPADPPVVSFSYSGNTSFAPCIVTFNNNTTNAVSYNWTFGDGGTSSEKSPQHLYSNGGTYNVILNATNSDGLTVSLTKAVNVKNKPTKVSIKQVTITYLSFTNSSGVSWDASNGPDTYYEVSDYPSGTTYYTSGYIANVVPADIPLSFSAYTITLSNLTRQYKIRIYDDDGIWGSEFIGGYYFSFSDYMPTNGDDYPTVINMQNSTSYVKLKLNIVWLQ